MSRFAIGAFAVGLFMFIIACGSEPTSQQITATGAPAVATVQNQVSSELPTAEPEPTAEAEEEPTEVPEPTAVPALPKIGDRVEHQGTALTITSIERIEQAGEFMKPKEGNEYVVIEVLIENAGTEKADYNPLYFKLKDGEGYEYNANAFVGIDQALSSGDLSAGDKARGKVVFETPKGAAGLVVQYEPIHFGDDGVDIRIALE